ncbi:hypothetical protein BOTBODRAFT_181375 [Botryobasidium botryosum FD-172 SS1]|uniref:Uncharacterized protein n=1 Tax=Botryobasidium botryosum (strain FD-172 SS1) TaxID=930990 RepID=A0A067LWJ4_BOTB1|nr:hypothetical protein BOTBODRAFT_181375 [Botryobasidium botryosum FD-172 SS1]
MHSAISVPTVSSVGFIRASSLIQQTIPKMATICNGGKCPSPKSLIEKQDIAQLGTKDDRDRRISTARRDDEDRRARVNKGRDMVYNQHVPLGSKKLDEVLKARSEVLTANAFSERLCALGFDYHDMLVNDFLHEWEIGNLMGLLKHIIRILYAHDPDLVIIFNERFRLILPFARDTIRKFVHNVSDMKNFAGRDYKDVLQCIIPVFYGLLPEPHNSEICTLLLAALEFHTLAKLRLHTDDTLADLDGAIVKYGCLIRRFATYTCPAFSTKDTPKEAEAKARKRAKKERATKEAGTAAIPANSTSTTTSNSRGFSLAQYKLYALGYYPATIRSFGTTEGYSVLRGEPEHRTAKTLYKMTSKTSSSTKQMTAMETIEHHLNRINDAINAILPPALKKQPRNPIHHDPSARYEMAIDAQEKIELAAFLSGHINDPAVHMSHMSSIRGYRYSTTTTIARSLKPLPYLQMFWEKLIDFHIAELRGKEYNGEDTVYSNEERYKIQIKGNFLHVHPRLRLNYTSYDVRRGQDALNLRSNRHDIFVPSGEKQTKTSHPFWYARILGIFHTFALDLSQPGASFKRVEFLWVRWFGNEKYRDGAGLARVAFMDPMAAGSFGFVSPRKVIRASHINPAFHYGRDPQWPSGTTFVEEEGGDWTYYYVNHHVDRDMYMRYRGGGIGHQNTCDIQSEKLAAAVPAEISDGAHDVEMAGTIGEEPGEEPAAAAEDEGLDTDSDDGSHNGRPLEGDEDDNSTASESECDSDVDFDV